MKLLYICSSQFSGTTLTSFLLNSHTQIATIGHTTGWPHAADDDFRCSCGERLADCRLFRQVAHAFNDNGLRFDPVNFGTDFRLSGSRRFNQILTGPLPGLRSSPLEYTRDRIVELWPPYRKTLARQEQTNRVLMQTVLDFHGASVYLDNSHSPYRFRRLAGSDSFTVLPLHLIRDPRGVCLSLMTNSGYEARQAVNAWIGHQTNIHRITNELGTPLILQYESLCRQPEETLGSIYDYAGVAREPLVDDFKDTEHHILGNRMRLEAGKIRLDERWRRDLSAEDRSTIESGLSRFCDRGSSHPLAAIIKAYLDS